MKKEKYIIPIVVFVVVAVGLMSFTIQSRKNEIRYWANARGETVSSVEYQMYLTGPYLPLKNTMVFKLKTSTNIYWIRYALWYRTIKQEIKNNDYQKIE